MRRVVVLCCVVALVCARPLEWFADESTFEAAADSKITKGMTSAVEKDWVWPSSPAHQHQISGATSFLQVTTGGHPLECDCERVKCNCVKRCECQLPAAAQNRAAAQFIELASATGKNSAPLWVDTDTNECFLETGVSVGQDTHHMLDCECDKVKCNCVKHCECSLPSTAAGASTGENNLLQLDQGAAKAEEDKIAPVPAEDKQEKAAPAPEQQQPAAKKQRGRKAQKTAGEAQYEYEYSKGAAYNYSYSGEEYSHNE